LPKIPRELKPTISSIEIDSKVDGKERVVTICRNGNKTNVKVNKGFTDASLPLACNKEDKRFGDIHTHPSTQQAMGITPSVGDFTVNLAHAREQNSKQVMCITNYDSKNIHCVEPKKIPSSEKVIDYEIGRINSYGINIDPYVLDNVPKDFNHIWLDKQTLNSINPSAETVVSDALGKSNDYIRKNMRDVDKDSFCRKIIQNFNKPTDNRVHEACKEELRRRGLFDWLLDH